MARPPTGTAAFSMTHARPSSKSDQSTMIPRHACRRSGPAASWIAPSTTPPPSSHSFAALTIASTSMAVISPRCTLTVVTWSAQRTGVQLRSRAQRGFRLLQAEVMRLRFSAVSQRFLLVGFVQSRRLSRAPETSAKASKSRRFRVTRGSCLATATAAISRSPKLCFALRAEPAHMVAATSAARSSTGRTMQA
jgi:hypothetical protein